MDKRVDGPRPGPYGPIPHWGDARVTRSTRGSGRPGHEPDGSRKTGRSSPSVRDESTPGAVPRRVVRRPRRRTVGSQARAAPDARPGHRRSCPPRTTPPSGRGLDDLGLELPARRPRAAIEGHVRLLLAWTPAINLTAIRDPAAVATGHVVDSLTALPWLARSTASTGSSTSGPAAASRACRLPPRDADAGRRRSLEPIAKKARFLETVVEATDLAGRVEVDRARAEDLARRPDHVVAGRSSRARAVASQADLVELAFPLAGAGRVTDRLEARRPDGRAGRRSAGDRRARRRHDRGRGCPRRGLRDHRLVVVTRDPRRARPGSIPARPGGTPPDSRGDRDPPGRHPTATLSPMRVAVLSDIHSNIVALDAVLRHAGDVDAIWHLGDVVGYGPEPDARGGALERARGGRRARQPRRRGDRRARDRLVQPGGARGRGMDPRHDVVGDAVRGWPACPSGCTIGDVTLVHGSPRDPLREYVTDRDVALREPGGTRDPARPARPYPRAGRAGARRRMAVALVQARDTTALELGTSPIAAQSGQRRAAARRRSAGGLPGARPRGRTRDLAPRGVRHRAASRPGIRAAGLPGSARGTSGDRRMTDQVVRDRRPAAAAGPQARRQAGPRRAAPRAVSSATRARAS